MHLRIRLAIAVLVAASLSAEEWKAPAEAAAVANPVPANAASIAAGKVLYAQYCVICHGETGKGDGAGAAALNPKPASLSDPAITSQSDGALYHKINTGRTLMPGWKAVLTDDNQRWQLVNYIRTFAAPTK